MKRVELHTLVISNQTEWAQQIQDVIQREEIDSDIALYINERVERLENLDFVIWELGEMSALRDFIGKIKSIKKFSEAPIVVAINIEQKGTIKELMALGVDDYIVRPCEVEELLLKFRNWGRFIKVQSESKNNKIQFDALLNNLPYMSWFKDRDSHYIKVNNDFKEHCGKDFEMIDGRDDKFVWDGRIGDRCRDFDLRVMNERKSIVFDEVIPGKKGYKQFHIHKAPVLNEYDEVIGTIGIAKDITELKNHDARMNAIMDHIPLGICLKDNDGVILNINKKFTEFLQAEREECIGININDILPAGFEDEIIKEDEAVKHYKKTMVFERCIEYNNEQLILEVSKTPVVDISGEVTSSVILYRDVTNERSIQAYTEKLAYTDYLTNLANRRGLRQYIEDMSKQHEEIVLMFIDLDNFKELNDSSGHYYGDCALILIAQKLSSLCEDGFVARVGGDEFVVVWKNFENKEILLGRIKEVIEGIRTECKKDSKMHRLSATIGIVKGNAQTEDLETLLSKGDFALYKGKEKGKNQYVFYTDDLEKERSYRLQIKQDIRNAIKNEEIVLYYQAQCALDGTVKGYEALFRWHNEKYKSVPVINIIKLIEGTHLIDEVGKYILKKAFIFAKKINKNRQNPLVVSVNISALQIMNCDFVANFKELLAEVDVPPHYIGIEITETVLLENIDVSINKIKKLKKMGIIIVLDDFGTGYSSLNYLFKLPISKIKIDKSFIRDMQQGDENIKLIKLIIDIAHLLQLPVVAEGVEEKSELDILKDLSVDCIQGYLFSRPLPEQEIKMLTEDR